MTICAPLLIECITSMMSTNSKAFFNPRWCKSGQKRYLILHFLLNFRVLSEKLSSFIYILCDFPTHTHPHHFWTCFFKHSLNIYYQNLDHLHSTLLEYDFRMFYCYFMLRYLRNIETVTHRNEI